LKQTVAVIGSGVMGGGIAQASALAGYAVILYDLDENLLQSSLARISAALEQTVKRGKLEPGRAKGLLQAIETTTMLDAAAAADLVIEAAPENLAMKQEIFRRLDQLAPEHTILASNTSSLSINALAGATERGDRFLGLHFFNPAHIMKLVEIIPGEDTSAATLAEVDAFVERLGKIGVHCKDTPAFIVNRVARPYYGEAFRLLGENAASFEEIDRLLMSAGFRMGPFELVDLIGCDVNYAVTQSVYEAYFQDPKYRPHPIQRRMVESGRLGRKSGRGFYDYH
jgi:3-hydroxybutyryl-CoA dehydrogenase